MMRIKKDFHDFFADVLHHGNPIIMKIMVQTIKDA